MLNYKALIHCVLLLFLTCRAFSNETEIILVSGDTTVAGMSQDETILFNMINDIRRQGKLPLIPLSPDLCKVAQIHIADIIASRPQDNGCSLHSWSSSGKWTACCHSKDPAGIQCMKSKPKEITSYQGNGYELIYWGDENATPGDAAALWQQVDASADMILCRGKWKGYQWKALGVGLKDGYAVLWLGDKTDVPHKANQSLNEKPVTKASVVSKPVMKEPKTTKSHSEDMPEEIVLEEEVKNPAVNDSAPKYHLIVSSVKTVEAAQPELKRIKSKGYPNAYIIEGESVYRIALESFDNTKQASKRLSELKPDFPGIWIYKK